MGIVRASDDSCNNAIERDPSRDDVPATVSRTESDVVLALERFERLGLDERDLVSRFIGS